MSNIAFNVADRLGRIQKDTNISRLNTVHRWAPNPVDSSSLPFCVRFNRRFNGKATYTPAATLDTGLGASDYPGGVHTRLLSNHFQFAPAEALLSGSVP